MPLHTPKPSANSTTEKRNALADRNHHQSGVRGVAVRRTDQVTPQAWDAKSINWQKVDPEGTKWAVLQGRSDVPSEAFTYAAFIPAGHTMAADENTIIIGTAAGPWHTHHPEEHRHH
jgi:hypothetical protein